MEITRQLIIETLKRGLENEKCVFAMWLEGADATGRVDQYSDIDIWIDSSSHIGWLFSLIRKILSQIGDLDFEYEVSHPHEKIRQRFYHLKNSSKFLVIDVCVQTDRNFWFSEGMKDEKAKVVFDKREVIRFGKVDLDVFIPDLYDDEVKEVIKTYKFFQVWVEKEIERNNYLEALSYYHKFVMEPLIKLLRFRYEPTKYDFRYKHIKRDLPKEIVGQLEDLHRVNSVQEMEVKMKKANDLFFVVLNEIDSPKQPQGGRHD